jgi:hypothetical protein
MKWRSSGGTIVTQHSTPSRTGEFSKRLLLARGGVFSCAKFELLSVGLGRAAGEVGKNWRIGLYTLNSNSRKCRRCLRPKAIGNRCKSSRLVQPTAVESDRAELTCGDSIARNLGMQIGNGVCGGVSARCLQSRVYCLCASITSTSQRPNQCKDARCLRFKDGRERSIWSAGA